MTPITRRGLVAVTSAGLGLFGAAQASEPPLDVSPTSLRGTVKGANITLPPLDNPADLTGAVPTPHAAGRRLGVAVVGLGRLSLTQILPAFAQSGNVRVTALVSGDPAKARVVAAQYDVPKNGLYDYKTFDTIKQNPDVDIVYIVLPNALHAEFTVRAAAAGKHVLCEKPMATSVADAQRMVDACKKASRKLMIAYRCQYLPEYRELIRLTRAQIYGPVRLIEACNGQNNADNGQWRHNKAMAGGGSLPDVGLYCLNAARFITGEEPIEITARITQPTNDPRFREVEDICAFTLRFPSGILASCTSGYSFRENRFLRLMATDASIGLDPAFSYDNLTMQVGRRDGMSSGLEQRRWPAKSQFANEMDAFAQSIWADVVPLTPGEEGLQDMRLIAAIYEAAASGKAVRFAAAEKADFTRGPPPQVAP